MIRGERVRELRERRGYSREKLAMIINIGVAQVARYERGENDATGDIIERLATLFNVSTDYLLGLTDNPTPSALQGLNEKESAVLLAWRRGDALEAIKVIIDDE